MKGILDGVVKIKIICKYNICFIVGTHKGSILDDIVRISKYNNLLLSEHSKYNIFYYQNAQRQQVHETILMGTQAGSTRELSLWKERSINRRDYSLWNTLRKYERVLSLNQTPQW